MYLSKVLVKPRSIRNAYEIHQCLWELFPGIDKGGQRPFLYRVESVTPKKEVNILMQSVMPVSDDARILATRKYDPKLKTGQYLRFLVRANPVKRLKQERCRVPYIREDHQKEWLKRKFGDIAEISEPFNADSDYPLYFRKQNEYGKIATVTYNGVLQIRDVNRFIDLIEKGIGPAKGFGCGMISLARI